MGIILDIVLIAIIALNVFICYKKGLVKLAVGLIAVAAAIILALVFYKPVSNLIIENTELDENIEKAIINNFTSETQEGQEIRYVSVLDYLQKYVDDAVNKTQTEIVTQTAGMMAVKIINVAVLIGIFLLAFSSFFYLTTIGQSNIDLTYLFYYTALYGLMFIVPLLTMWTFSGERKSGTDQLLLTSPVSMLGVVIAKFLSALLLIVIPVAKRDCATITTFMPSYVSKFLSTEAPTILLRPALAANAFFKS